MATTRRITDSVFRRLTAWGLGASYRYVLTVPGRRTGRLYRTPVDVVDRDGSRWLVAGYGLAEWVLNARAAGEVTLSRGSRSERFTVGDVPPAEAVPVLRRYLHDVRVTRRYFDATPDSPDRAIAAELPRHPVLRLEPVPRSAGSARRGRSAGAE